MVFQPRTTSPEQELVIKVVAQDQGNQKIRVEFLRRVSQLCFALSSENDEAECKCGNGGFSH